jgi:PAS domain S-box-containing protein
VTTCLPISPPRPTTDPGPPTLGGIAALHFAGLSVLAILVFYYLDSQGIMLEPLISFNHLALFIIFSANIFLAALVLILVLRKYEDTFAQLVENEQSLHRANLELEWEIEAREQAEVYYKQSEERFKSALQDSPYPTMLHAENGEILFINTAWINKSGYKEDEFSSINELNDHIFRNGEYQVSEELKKLIGRVQEHNEGYYTIYTKQGDSKNWYFRWALLPDLPDGRCIILTVAVDMTNLMAAESALRRSEENLSRLSLVTNDGIWDWDLKTDQVVYDPRYYTMAGYEIDEFPHQLEEFRKRVHPDDVDRVFSQAESHLAGKSDHYAVEFRFLMKDGSWLWILGRGNIVEQDEFGDPLRFVGTHTDISDRKKTEEELNQYRRQLEDIVADRTQKLEDRIVEVEKLNAALSNILDDYQIANQKLSRVSSNLSETNQELESLTYIVSNDLRYPLDTIKELSQKLSDLAPKGLDKKSLGQLKQIHNNAVQMENLVNVLINLSQINQIDLNLERTEPARLVREVLEPFADQIRDRNIIIEIQELPPCQADSDLLRIVFQSLISNAIKFTIMKQKPHITIGWQPDDTNDRLIYFVKDNGIGFSMKDQEKVFEIFQRLHDQDEFKGAGIGLALAKKIINRHNGEIWAEAKKKQGAAFYLDLPRAEKPN